VAASVGPEPALIENVSFSTNNEQARTH